jgi:hypothetical protein
MKRIVLLIGLIACMSVAGIATTLKRGPLDDRVTISMISPQAASALIPPMDRTWEVASATCTNTTSGNTSNPAFSLHATDGTIQGSADTPTGNVFGQYVTQALVLPDDGDMGTWNQKIPKGGSLQLATMGKIVFCTFELVDVS